MRRRLMVALVGLVAAVLVIAGAGSLILTRNSARQEATQQLVTEAQSLTSAKSGVQSLQVLRVIRKVLKLEDAVVIRISVSGTIVSVLPAGITADELQPQSLLTGQAVSGRNGTLVFAAAPVQLSAKERLRLRLYGALAVVLTRQVGDLGPSWGYFLAAGGGALAIAALVAWQMSRRMARPLIEAMDVTGRIAAGDLESRVPIRDGDYSEFSSLANSINEMAQGLQASKTRERDLLLSVSHDLRTPLTSIRGFAEAITDGAVEDTAQAADVITAEARRLERLVGDLLDLTKLEASQLSITMRRTDAAEVVNTTTEGFRPTAQKNGVSLIVNIPAGSVQSDAADAEVAVAADPDRLAQLLANLIENALSFARQTVVVTVFEPRPEDPHVRVEVEDDGPGIAPEDLTRVFERFYRADRGPKRQLGSGLGLAIVSQLAAAMGARVQAVSPTFAGGGSRFVILLALWDGRS
jgi:signal transduction histidine kinase